MERMLNALLDSGGPRGAIPSPVMKTVAPSGEGIEALWEEMQRSLRSQSPEEREQRQRRRISWMFKTILREKIAERLTDALPAGEFETLVDRICRREVDPYTLADRVLRENREG
jgi:LAO/AO transport system kinase